MQALERWGYSDGRGAGARHAAAGVAVALAAGRLVRSTTVATWSAVAGRSLGESATAIGDALAVGDLERARDLLPTLVGRDPRALADKEIARAVVGSVAGNTVVTVLAPAHWSAAGWDPGVPV